MIVPTYLTLSEASQFLREKTAQPVTANWLLRHASEEKLQMFFHPQQYVITGYSSDADNLKYYEPGKKYPLDKDWATLMIAHHSINLETLPDAKGKASFITDPNTEKRIKILLVENDVYVLASEISLLANAPDHKRPDYQKWKRSELWTIAEAAYLLSDIEPISLDTTFHPKNMEERTSEIYQNIKHAIENGKISQHGKNRSGLVAGKKILPRDAVVWFANWCVNSSTFSLPDELWDLHPYKSRVKPEFNPNESLVTAMQGHLESPYSSLPDYLRNHIDAAFPSSSEWDHLTKNRRLNRLDYYDLQYNPLREVEHAAGWWGASMDASAWWNAESVTPLHAAMLLARYNPNKESEADAETNSSDEMGPDDFKRLKNTFEGALDKTKTLKAWIAYARERDLKIHSWISEWEAWIIQASMNEKSTSKPRKHATSPPNFYRPQRISADSGYTEDEILGLGLNEVLQFLVFLPGVGACRVPIEALEHFLADTDLNEYDAGSLEEYWSHEKSQPWKIKRNALCILAESWEQWAKIADEIALTESPSISNSDSTPLASPTEKIHTLVPGTLPANAIGKLAIEAAWEIECSSNSRATDKEVMTRLQKWAEDGTKPEVLRTAVHEKRSVAWITLKGKEKLYSLEACQKTLARWNISRQ